MNKIDWLGYGVDIDDAAFWERYNTAKELVASIENDASVCGDEADKIRSYCAAFRKFYVSLLGEEAAAEILSGVGDNRRKMDDVYESLLRHIHEQRTESSQRLIRILLKYAPRYRGKSQEDGNGTAASTV